MAKPKPTRTINPTHMEDLDPRRFEDMVRQLMHGFRAWKSLEPTGRLGADEGIDIVGVEVGPAREPAAEDEEDDVNESPAEVSVERTWRIQCKRYKKLGPSQLEEIVADLVPGKAVPDGILVATAADVSAKGFAAFHQEAVKRGIREHVLWTRTIIEDLLYRPQNDHLLFAYFGISLQAKRQTRLAEVRRRIAIKRKILRAIDLKPEAMSRVINKPVLVRDIEDVDFPYTPDRTIEIPTPESRSAPWQDCRLWQFHPRGVIVNRRRFIGRRTSAGWDLLQESEAAAGYIASDVRQRESGTRDGAADQAIPLYRIAAEIPKNEGGSIFDVELIAYEGIIEVDPIGEKGFEGAHLLCRFAPVVGPYVGRPGLIFIPDGFSEMSVILAAKERADLFSTLRAEAKRKLDEGEKAKEQKAQDVKPQEERPHKFPPPK